MHDITRITGLAALVALSFAAPTDWSAELSPASGSRVSGTVAVVAMGGDSARATVQVANAAPGSKLDWEIRRGTCGGNSGHAVSNPALFPDIQVGKDGRGTATATLPSQPPTTGTFAVTVGQTGQDGKTVACGELKPKDNAAMPAPKDSTTMRP